jgi:ribosomal protein S27AE
MRNEIKVSFCPKCKSTDVKYVFGLGNLFGVIPRQRCGKCGRTGVFPILVANKKKLAKAGRGKK